MLGNNISVVAKNILYNDDNRFLNFDEYYSEIKGSDLVKMINITHDELVSYCYHGLLRPQNFDFNIDTYQKENYLEHNYQIGKILLALKVMSKSKNNDHIVFFKELLKNTNVIMHKTHKGEFNTYWHAIKKRVYFEKFRINDNQYLKYQDIEVNEIEEICSISECLCILLSMPTIYSYNYIRGIFRKIFKEQQERENLKYVELWKKEPQTLNDENFTAFVAHVQNSNIFKSYSDINKNAYLFWLGIIRILHSIELAVKGGKLDIIEDWQGDKTVIDTKKFFMWAKSTGFELSDVVEDWLIEDEVIKKTKKGNRTGSNKNFEKHANTKNKCKIVVDEIITKNEINITEKEFKERVIALLDKGESINTTAFREFWKDGFPKERGLKGRKPTED